MLTPRVTEVKRHGGKLASACARENARRDERRRHLQTILQHPDNRKGTKS